MLLTTHVPGLRLADRQVARLRRAAGTRLEARDGHLWITQDGELDDHVLDAGEAWTVPADAEADIVVSAFRGDATLLLRDAEGRTPCMEMALVGDDLGARLGRWFGRLGFATGDAR